MAAQRGGGRTPTTAPPLFDPEAFARESEEALKIPASTPTLVPPRPSRSEPRATKRVHAVPPLNARVALTVPVTDLAWFDLSEGALAIAAEVDGEKTLLELLDLMAERTPPAGLAEVGELQDADVLRYDES
jgi:hypothetical protein